MNITITVPDIGEDKFPIIEILAAAGDSVAKEDGIVLLESDKASMEVPAPADGVIEQLSVQVGDSVGTGDVIGVLIGDSAKASADSAEAATSTAVTGAEKTTEKAAEKTPETIADTAPPTTSAVPAANIDEAAFRAAHASPSIRKLARELGADLGKIKGSGRKNRITEVDVKQYVKGILSGSSAAHTAGFAAGAGIPAVPAQDFSKFGAVEENPLSKINKLTGEHMTRCWLNIPHVTQFDEADITDIELFRKSLKAEAEKLGIRVTMLSFLMKAVASGLKAFPRFNASLSA
ncbi:MAG: hypothetical protein CR977_02675, partial [Gammaproteobacteria bacterium]